MSSDNTVEKCREFQKSDDRITLIKLDKNCGSAVARQSGIEISDGDLVTFVDADDWYCDADALSKVVDIYRKWKVDCIMFSYRTVHRHNIILRKKFNRRGGYYTVRQFAEAKSCSSLAHWHYVWNKCFKGDILRSGRVIFHAELRRAQDVRFNQDFLRVANNFYIMKSAYLYDYNCTNLNQITRRQAVLSLSNEIEHFNRLKEEVSRLYIDYKAIGASGKAINALFATFLQNVYSLLARNSSKSYFTGLNQQVLGDEVYQNACKRLGYKAKYIRGKVHFINRIKILKRLAKSKLNM